MSVPGCQRTRAGVCHLQPAKRPAGPPVLSAMPVQACRSLSLFPLLLFSITKCTVIQMEHSLTAPATWASIMQPPAPRGRGSHLEPANRFTLRTVERDLDQFSADDLAELARRPTRYVT